MRFFSFSRRLVETVSAPAGEVSVYIIFVRRPPRADGIAQWSERNQLLLGMSWVPF